MNQEIRQVKKESHSFDGILSKRLSEEGYEALASDCKVFFGKFFSHSGYVIQKSALARCLFHIHLIRKDKIHDWVTSTEGVSTYRYFQKSVAGESTPKQHGLSLCILAVFDQIAKGDEEWKKMTVLEAPNHIHEFLTNTNYQPGDSDTALWMWYTYIYATEHDDLYDFEAFDDSEAVDNPDGSDDWDSLYKSGVTDVFELLGKFEQCLSVPYSSEAIGRRKGIQAIREYWRLKLNSKASDESTIRFIRDCEQKRVQPTG